jgi:hypothetical protein
MAASSARRASGDRISTARHRAELVGVTAQLNNALRRQ